MIYCCFVRNGGIIVQFITAIVALILYRITKFANLSSIIFFIKTVNLLTGLININVVYTLRIWEK